MLRSTALEERLQVAERPAGQAIDVGNGDIPGAASRYLEESFDDRIVAVWSTGAARFRWTSGSACSASATS